MKRYVCISILIAILVSMGSMVVVTHQAVAAQKQKQTYVYKGTLLGQLRWACAVQGCYTPNGYDFVKKCMEKCVKLPPKNISTVASRNQKLCKKGIFKEREQLTIDDIDKSVCEHISKGRDIVEVAVNRGSGTEDDCPVGATLKGSKCTCPKGTSKNKDRTECEKTKSTKEVNENIKFIEDLFSRQKTQKKVSQPTVQPQVPPQQVPQQKINELQQPTVTETAPTTWYMRCGNGCPDQFTCRNVERLFASACATPLYNDDRSRKDCEGSLGGEPVSTLCVKKAS